MNFNSIAYAIFLPIVFVLYWKTPHRFRLIVLLLSSYYFYMSWNPQYVLLLMFTTGTTYGAARLIHVQNSKQKRKWTLIGAVFICFSILFFFKYFEFAFEIVRSVFGVFTIELHPITLKLLLPVGISFYIFQTISYVIDVYKGKIEPERNFFAYAT